MSWIFALLLCQDAARIRAAMAPAIAKQQTSVQRQTAPPAKVAPVACEAVPQTELARMIDRAAQSNGVEPAIVREVARAESAFRPCAVSNKGAEGLMQLMPATQAQFSVGDPFDPEQSLAAGSKLLRQLIDRYHGDLTLALSAYNAGAGAVDRAGGVPEIPETRNYVQVILSRLLP